MSFFGVTRGTKVGESLIFSLGHQLEVSYFYYHLFDGAGDRSFFADKTRESLIFSPGYQLEVSYFNSRLSPLKYRHLRSSILLRPHIEN